MQQIQMHMDRSIYTPNSSTLENILKDNCIQNLLNADCMQSIVLI